MNITDPDISVLFGATWVSNERIKSEGYFKVPLLKKPLNILNKYRYARDRGKRKEIFPYISNQQINRAIKVILQISRIHKKITFHKMRHTFGTTVTLPNNMPIESLMKMMGHSKISSTLEYAQVVDSKLMKDM